MNTCIHLINTRVYPKRSATERGRSGAERGGAGRRWTGDCLEIWGGGVARRGGRCVAGERALNEASSFFFSLFRRKKRTDTFFFCFSSVFSLFLYFLRAVPFFFPLSSFTSDLSSFLFLLRYLSCRRLPFFLSLFPLLFSSISRNFRSRSFALSGFLYFFLLSIPRVPLGTIDGPIVHDGLLMSLSLFLLVEKLP